MIMPYRLTSTIIGVSIALTILFLVRKDYIHVRHTLWWFLLAIASIIAGAFPNVVDRIAWFFGVNYPPTLFFSLGFAALFLKILKMDIELSKQEKEIKRLIQRIAILEKRDRGSED
ncbi:MAG: DUF2304 domain-containing protein [Syntrophobacterales bacterium]|nr:DUF2304 domain-containing protein [Syntrophobacterales bacterium]